MKNNVKCCIPELSVTDVLLLSRLMTKLPVVTLEDKFLKGKCEVLTYRDTDITTYQCDDRFIGLSLPPKNNSWASLNEDRDCYFYTYGMRQPDIPSRYICVHNSNDNEKRIMINMLITMI